MGEEDIFDRRVTVRISEREIVRLLDMPDGTRVRGIYSEIDPPCIKVALCNPQFDVIPFEAEAYQVRANVIVHRKIDEDGLMWERKEIALPL